MNNKLMIGWSEADITPATEKLISLDGQYYERLTREIHSRLKTVAAAFSSGNEYLLIASIDNVSVSEPFHRLVRKLTAELAPEINPEHIFLNAIHTHNAPSAKLKDSTVPPESETPDVLSPHEYVEFAAPIIAQNLADAWRNRREGGIARAFGNARIGHCRRALYTDGSAEMYGDVARRDFAGMEGGEDSGVEMLLTFDASGKRTGMLLNAACPSQVMEATYKVSSDFAGATRELLKREYGDGFHTIYQVSSAGCQSPRDLVRHYAAGPDFWHEDGVAELSRRLARAVIDAQPGAVDYAPVFKCAARRVALPRRRASYREYVRAKEELARLTAIMPKDRAFADFCAATHANEQLNGPGPYDSKLHHFVLMENAEAVIKRYGEQDRRPDIAFDMLAARLGDIALATNPFELYLHFGQIIKARSKAKQTFLVQLTAGADPYAGYLPSPDAEKAGGYGGLIINGQVGSDGGYLLADLTVDAINRMFE